jgi:hypothetical protein
MTEKDLNFHLDPLNLHFRAAIIKMLLTTRPGSKQKNDHMMAAYIHVLYTYFFLEGNFF